MKPHSREFYVLIAATIILPILLIFTVWGIGTGTTFIIKEMLYPPYAHAKINGSQISFNLTDKSEYISTFSQDRIMKIFVQSEYYRHYNKSDFDNLAIYHKYSCNLSDERFFPNYFSPNFTISDCIETNN